MPSIIRPAAVLGLFLPVFYAMDGPASGGTIQALDASYAQVNAAVTAANPGDTVIVPQGTAMWSSTLTITKRITLQGAGIDKTVITGNVGRSAYMIKYAPTDAFSNSYFRLSGFTLNSNNNSQILSLSRETITDATWVRIDHNRFICTTTTGGVAFFNGGSLYGVFDNNAFENACLIHNWNGVPSGGGKTTWQNATFSPGTHDNLYFEDNTFNVCFTAVGAGHGGRYANRYNTYNLQDPRACYASLYGFYPLHDAHGNQGSGVYANMGVELYGNKVNSTYDVAPFLDQRGGKAVVFFNKVIGTSSVNVRVREECQDSISPPATAPDGTPQHVNHSYYWNNRIGATGTALMPLQNGGNSGYASVCSSSPGTPLIENADYWDYTPTFDGSVGVGCGTLSDRPATCTIGVAYWATDESCSSVSEANVGANPTTPLAGTLYTCTAPNTWTAYFTPFVYPHPFRLPGAPTSPTPPTNLRIIR